MAGSEPSALVRQVERYRFEAMYPGAPFGPLVLDEPAPTGGDAGPNPVRTLATAVGHCLGSTLFHTLERARVPAAPIHVTVEADVGRNPQGRLRVQALRVELETRPLNEDDRPRFQHSVEIFEDFCTVTGAVREGIPVATHVGPGPA